MKQLLTSIGKWLAMISIIVGIVMTIRLFCVESYRVSTTAMEEALHEGDYILVNKLPMEGNPGRNKVVLFSSPLQQDTLHQPLFLSRCIGMPGDTIFVNNNGYKVNGIEIPYSPRALNTYLIPKKMGVELLQILRKRNIPTRNWKNDPHGFSLSLTSFEEYQLREELSEEGNRSFIRKQFAPYQLIVPRKGFAYRLDQAAIIACKEAILTQAGENAVFRDGKLYVDGKETTFFFFKQDYYWMLSDNVNEAIDSRHLGFIPHDHIIGNAWFCWFSQDKEHFFKPVN
ncbi:MAG: signal peptidase I [Parabacteroides sp.]|nr:signal peptidase I [Parabacteroides sp.]